MFNFPSSMSRETQYIDISAISILPMPNDYISFALSIFSLIRHIRKHNVCIYICPHVTMYANGHNEKTANETRHRLVINQIYYYTNGSASCIIWYTTTDRVKLKK